MTTTLQRRTRRDGTQRPTGHKSVLICPTCGHESPPGVGGDWRVTETTDADGRQLVYDCPVCWTTVITQPQLNE